MIGMVSTARPEDEGTKKESATSSPNMVLMKPIAGRPLTAPSAQNRMVSVILPASITTTMPRAMPMTSATPRRSRAPSTKVFVKSSSLMRAIHADQDRSDDEEAGHLRHPPAAGGDAPDHDREAEAKIKRMILRVKVRSTSPPRRAP